MLASPIKVQYPRRTYLGPSLVCVCVSVRLCLCLCVRASVRLCVCVSVSVYLCVWSKLSSQASASSVGANGATTIVLNTLNAAAACLKLP
eukprot:13653449-Alexandrium_andersonii.AAC.1